MFQLTLSLPFLQFMCYVSLPENESNETESMKHLSEIEIESTDTNKMCTDWKTKGEGLGAFRTFPKVTL